MNNISQNYINLLENLVLDIFKSNIKNKLKQSNEHSVVNYINLISNIDGSLSELACKTLVNFIEAMDVNYLNSKERKSKYYIKSHHRRTILTIFGEISIKRTFYESKLDGRLYCYVDRFLGLHKYDYFDPYIKASIVNYAADNSYPKVASYINDLIGNRVSIKEKTKYLSRQSIRNIILSSKESNVSLKRKDKTPDVLHIIADEKWIHTQNNNGNDVMEKSIVLFEDIKNGKIINKQIFASKDNSFLDESLDYIYTVYDIDSIKTIYVMGAGAKWIKSLNSNFQFNSKIRVIHGLDKFHFKQALHHLCQDKELEKITAGYILYDKKESFKELCNALSHSHPERSGKIEEKQKYILNNWKHINNLYKYNLSCPMESQISHNIAALFTSRPKAYSTKMINKLTKLRLLYKNNYNIKELYLNNFNSNITLNIKPEFYNFSIFDKKAYNFNELSLVQEPFYPIPYDRSYTGAFRKKY